MIWCGPRAAASAVVAVALSFSLGSMSVAEEAPQRVVAVGGAVTEIVYALGEEGRLVARDTTSNHPPAALDLPDVGYIRALSAEGVLSVNPDMILSETGAGPIETIELLREAAVPVVEVNGGFSRDAIGDKVMSVAAVLGVPEKGAALAAKVDAEIAAAMTRIDATHRPKVLFVLSTAGGRVMAGGQNTSADAIIALAGGQNAAIGFEGFKPITDEAIVTSGAEVILMMDREGDHDASLADLKAHPSLGQTPAVQKGALVRIDGMLLLGFSVRTGQAISDLAAALAKVAS
ncbi:Hemin-binding periplasmic protein HmuT precursor [Shimia sp. SK013]|uniref:heme/hemin ABC transporter substrate-binding protein n=1 Tax=Shimia sp. SK013 TaxID=1389006 RepID=UPI0006B51D1C|nr:ABC transporter substrate-binding protein [Shimia sp. SK013]KPA22437.1 Hemin-binding periplasmic protein HmuT precursor [Shimia sp. SK013]